MINIKKIVSLLMSVLLIAGSIAAPAFAADTTEHRFDPISKFVGNTAKMEAADSLSGQALRVTGVKDGMINYGTKVWGYSEPQDWSGYQYCNMVVKNNSNSRATTVFIIMTPLLNKTEIAASDLSAGYWMKKLTIASPSWTLVSIPMNEIANKGSAPAKKNAVGGIVLAQTYGDFYVDSMWFSVEAPKEIKLVSTSIPDGYDDVSADSASFAFTFNNNLAPEANQTSAKISLKSAADATVEFDAEYSGNKLTITPKANLDYGTSYSLSISGVKDTLGVESKSTPLIFTTAAGSVVSATPVIATSAGTVQASTSVTNFTADSAAATLVLACYDGDGKMIKSKTKFEKVELAPAQSSPVTASVTGYSGESVCAL